jgi:hypothetical protein
MKGAVMNMGCGSSRFMFLVLAVQELMTEKSENQQ